MLRPERIRAILFDIDGTLSDTDDAYLDRLLRFTRPFGFLLGGDNQRELVRRWMMTAESAASHLYSLADRLGIDRQIDDTLDWLSRLRRTHQPDGFRLMDGVAPMLTAVARKFPLAIVTSRSQYSAEAFLAEFGLRSHFRAVISALSAPRIKPDPAPVLAAAGALGIPVEACLMVGDTRADILAGTRAGAQTAGVLCGFGRRADLERAGADAILGTTADLPSLLS
jgi:phosphoglycolate phosphatase